MKLAIPSGDSLEVYLIAENDHEDIQLAGLYACGVQSIQLRIDENDNARWLVKLRRTPREVQRHWESEELERLWQG